MTLYIDLEWTPSLMGFLEDLQQTPTGQRGRNYALDERVHHITATPDGLAVRAAVEGTDPRPYLTTLHLEGDHFLTAECSCPIGEDCKHGYALALTLAGGAFRLGSKYQQDLKRLLPQPWRSYSWTPPAELFEGVQALFVRVTEDAPEPAPQPKLTRQLAAGKKLNPGKSKKASAALPPPPPAPVRPWWERLWTATSDQGRERILMEVCEKRIGSNRYHYPYMMLNELKSLGNNAAILMHLEEELAEEAQSEGRKLKPPEPEYLAFRDSPMVQQAWQAYQEARCNHYLREWLDSTAAPHPAEGAQECTLELFWELMPVSAGISQVAFELLITTAKMSRRARKPQAIRQLANELAYGKRTTRPLMRELVEWLGSDPEITNPYGKPPWGNEAIIPVNNVLKWVGAWGAQNILRWEDNSPVVFDPRPARLRIERLGGQEDIWTVEYPPEPSADPGAPGPSQPLAEAAVFCDGGSNVNSQNYYDYSVSRKKRDAFYVRQGATIHPLDAQGMEPQALGAARMLRKPPIEMMLKRPQGLRMLRRLVREGPQENAGEPSLVREVSIEPVVEMKITRGEWISASVWGRTAEGRIFLRAGTGEWVSAPESIAKDGSPFSNTGDEALESLNPDPGEDAPSSGEMDPPAENAPAPEAPAPRALVELPRLAELEPLEAWLAGLTPPQTQPINYGQDRIVWRWPLTPQYATALLRKWQERPPGVAYLGNPEFLKLITPANRPMLRISVEPAGVDWLAVSVQMEEELERIGARELRALLASSADALVRLPNGRLYRRDGLEEYERELAAIEDAGLAPGRKSQRLHALHLAGQAGGRLIELGGGDERLAELARAVREVVKKFKGIPPAPVAQETAAHLRPYQRAGADFIAWACRNFGGALLADDMGLGKTLQVLAVLTALRKGEKEHRPSLVICPASVAHNWEREVRRFAPGLRTLVIERGAGRKAMWGRFGEFDLVIKNYALTRRDAEVIRKYKWLMVCVDEAQAIKNPSSDIASVVKSIHAQYRIALTGTPIENRIGDLVSIMEFAAPGLLPEVDAGEEDSTRRLRARLRPVLLRRLKREVAPELPERIEERIDCAMTENQRLAYLAEVRRTREMLHGFKGDRVIGAARIQILAALTRLRQLCCDPALVNLPGLGSGKVEELMGLLPPILEEGNKVLVFSQFVRMLNRLGERLAAEKIPTYMLTGQTKPGERLALVDRFEHDAAPSVFLISLKAGGTGLNLVSAAHVVLFDPWWNPAVEAQAIDRTHRIGQDKTVLAFRLVTEGTIEERILELQEKKRGLVQNVLEEEAFNRTLTRDDFEFLLGE